MGKCKYFKEKTSSFKSFGPGGFEVDIIPTCTKPGLIELGATSEIVSCNGSLEKCPLKRELISSPPALIRRIAT